VPRLEEEEPEIPLEKLKDMVLNSKDPYDKKILMIFCGVDLLEDVQGINKKFEKKMN